MEKIYVDIIYMITPLILPEHMVTQFLYTDMYVFFH